VSHRINPVDRARKPEAQAMPLLRTLSLAGSVALALAWSSPASSRARAFADGSARPAAVTRYYSY
jgi:hypothetical protein